MGKKLTTEQYIAKVNKVHNFFYNYSLTEYTLAHQPITIICPLHGPFIQSANDHKKGSGCYQCGITKIKKSKFKDTDHFIKLSKQIHGDIYDYSLVDYKQATIKVKIICKKHGVFEQTPEAHYRNKGCNQCGNERCFETRIKNNNVSTKAWRYRDWETKAKNSNNFHAYQCYVIKCWNDNECFYKIGKSFRKLDKRFSNKKEMPYNWQVIKVWSGSALEISKLEKILQRINKNFKYKPSINFGGSFECFKTLKYMDLNRNVYEGWTPKDFINELEPQIDLIMSGKSYVEPLKSKAEVKKWCMENQPYYKKHIPEVVKYFCNKYKIK